MEESVLKDRASQFSIEGHVSSVKSHGEGHLHDTYLVTTHDKWNAYILQRINHHIFEDIPGVMSNIEKVTNHLVHKLTKIPGRVPSRESLTLVPLKSGRYWFQDHDGNYWRMYHFIDRTMVFQQIDHPALAQEAGRKIGEFQSMLADLPYTLRETLPRFHDIHFRREQFEEARKNGDAARIRKAREEIRFVNERVAVMEDYLGRLRQKAKVRVTHNDTKVNNILFDMEGRAACLIDLDTVMPGFVHFDFGDAIRTMTNTAVEDEQDLSRVHFNIRLYRAFREGYLSVAGGFLSDEEVSMLPFSAVYLTFLIGLRFLTDYMQGDVYFNTAYDDHNLVRTRVQFRMVSEMETTLDKMH